MKQHYLLALFILSFGSLLAQAPCDDGLTTMMVNISTDGFGYETSWSVTTIDGETLHDVPANSYANNQLYETQVCIPADACVVFTINDAYGDGLSENGYFNVILEGDTLVNNPSYHFNYDITANCAPGQSCLDPIVVTTGTYTTSYDNHWYIFSPQGPGNHLITTCGLSTCDTKIWVYDECNGNGLAEDNAGVIFFDNNDSDCAPQAQVEANLDPTASYLIRIGDHENACGDEITWQIVYLGETTGCTDSTACNYDPLATVDDGSCIFQGDVNCPDGPDLLIRQDVLAGSMYQTTINNNDPCLIEEGCVSGYGERDVIRFSTRIDNIGELDYFIGSPSSDNPQFTYNNCHNHFHYDGYAEYLLFDENGTQLPSSFKNGFCVLDLGCMWGFPQYGCNYMGISAGCYDEYWSQLGCQWLDLTDVEDGDYHFVTRVNWGNKPDFLGRLEKDTINNWAQVCINLDRSSGDLIVGYESNCAPFYDCAGAIYGNAQPDCNGDCNGTAIRGDLNENGLQEIIDAQTYVSSIIANDIEATTCNDLNSDGQITVYDAALLSDCINYGAGHLHEGVTSHDHCVLPGGVVNPFDTVAFTILEANFVEGYVDIGIQNKTSEIVAYQFSLQGVQVIGVESLVDPLRYPIAPSASMANNEMIGISYQDSTIERSAAYQPLARVYFSEVTEAFLCIAEVKEAVNQYYEQTFIIIEEGCVDIVGAKENLLEIQVNLHPNPMTDAATLSFPNPHNDVFELRLSDARGATIRTISNITTSSIEIKRAHLPAGIYFYQLKSNSAMASGRVLIN